MHCYARAYHEYDDYDDDDKKVFTISHKNVQNTNARYVDTTYNKTKQTSCMFACFRINLILFLLMC